MVVTPGIVGIPTHAKPYLADLAIASNWPRVLFEFHFLSYSTIQEGVEIAKRDRAADLKWALQEFETIRVKALQAKEEHVVKYFAREETKETLGRIVAKAPNHLSASLLLDWANGRLPDGLSPGASFFFIDMYAHEVYRREGLVGALGELPIYDGILFYPKPDSWGKKIHPDYRSYASAVHRAVHQFEQDQRAISPGTSKLINTAYGLREILGQQWWPKVSARWRIPSRPHPNRR